MKRYWKLIILVLVIVFSTGIFYTQASLAVKKLPAFHLHHLSGNPDELESLLINGYYAQDEETATLTVDKTGVTYEKPMSYIEMLSMDHYPKVIRDLQKKHRSFMRGKHEGMAVFFENDDFLVYADISMDFHYKRGSHSFMFDIEIFHKETKEKISFTSPVPQPERYGFMFSEAVQMIHEDQLKVVTRNNVKDPQNHPEETMAFPKDQEEIHIYTFDLADQSLTEDEVISIEEFATEALDVDQLSISVRSVHRRENIGPSEYFVFEWSASEMTMTNDGYWEGETIEGHLVAYHYETGELKTINVPDPEINVPVLLNDSILYFENFTEEQYQTLLYDIEKEEVLSKNEFTLREKPSDERWPYVFMGREKVYMVSSMQTKGQEAYIEIKDLKTGELLYEGVIEPEGEIEKDYRLELYVREYE